jgi:DNA repair protein RecO (recombination protein O)
MPARTDDALVLARYPFRERDLVVVLLTRESGQLRAVARRARGAHGQLAGVLEPLARVRVTYFRRAQSDLATLDEASLVRSAFPLAKEPAGWAAAQVLAELATVFCPEGQRAERAFRLLDHAVEALLGGGDPLAAAAYGELWFLRLAGVFPEMGSCGVCGAPLGAGPWLYDLRESRFVCAPHRPAGTVSRLSAAAVGWLSAASRAALEEVPTDVPEDALGWLQGLRERFTERELRSWAYLRLLLASDAPEAGP